MATTVITSLTQQGDGNGVPYSGAKIYVYTVLTTTLKSLFSDTGLSVAAANPIICDSAGRHDMRYLATGAYKIVVKTSADVAIYTRDNIDPGIPIGTGILAIANGGTSAATAPAALAALGGATSAEVAAVAAQVATIAGGLASTEATHIATGTTAQRNATPSEGDIRRNTTTSYWEGFVSSWKRFLTEDDIAVPLAGTVVQSSYTEYLTSADLTTQIPYDNTIPQIGEGTQIISVSFTPTSATNKLRFEFQGFGARAAGSAAITAALFGGGIGDAIAASAATNSTDDAFTLTLTHEEVSGTTSPKTFAIRVGPGAAVTVRMNGTSTARRLGGVAKSTLIITEIKV